RVGGWRAPFAPDGSAQGRNAKWNREYDALGLRHTLRSSKASTTVAQDYARGDQMALNTAGPFKYSTVIDCRIH
ncbi:MAG TPA: hypothetical protein VJV79_10060, partial [Polyangiaceae bacterium]|nr:hypothetical protein [Polyangiaceae bacterium]